MERALLYASALFSAFREYLHGLTNQQVIDLFLTIAAAIWLVAFLVRRLKTSHKGGVTVRSRKKRFHQKKWYPSGWYYDEEKKEWVAPDYKGK